RCRRSCAHEPQKRIRCSFLRRFFCLESTGIASDSRETLPSESRGLLSLDGAIMQLNPSEISELIRAKIQNLDTSAQVRTQGTVVSITDGICRVHGLSDAMQGEMLEFPRNTFGLALNLGRDSVGAVVLGEYTQLTGG